MFADFLWGIKLSEDFKDKRYLYVIKPAIITDDGSSGNDGLQTAVDTITEKVTSTYKKMDKMMAAQSKIVMDLADIQSQIQIIKE